MKFVNKGFLGILKWILCLLTLHNSKWSQVSDYCLCEPISHIIWWRWKVDCSWCKEDLDVGVDYFYAPCIREAV